MENLVVAGKTFQPGQHIVVTGKVGSGKTTMARRFATEAMKSGAIPLVITDTANVEVFRGFVDVACSLADARTLVGKATSTHGHLLLVLDNPWLAETLWPSILEAAHRSTVTIVHVKNKLETEPQLPEVDVVLATGVRMPVQNAKEAFEDATGLETMTHSRWQCASWQVKENAYEVFDL